MGIKSLFQSKSFWWAIAIPLWTLYQDLGKYADKGAIAPSDWYEIVGALLYAAMAAYFRYTTTDVVYTPPELPGRNREDARAIVNR